MEYTKGEILQFVEENDVKFIRLAFCDMFGKLKNISIMPDELPRAFDSGISFDASVIPGFMNQTDSDLFLFPDPQTLVVLPWRPQHGRVVRFYCDVRLANGQPFDGDGRHILKKVIDRSFDMGYNCKIGTECEFYLFSEDENGVKKPHDNAGYLDVAPLDKGENVRREICLTLEQMGISPESSAHRQGPGQNEIDFKYSDALGAADNLITFKTVVDTVAARQGLTASFMPCPIKGTAGSGLHVNMSLYKNGFNIFKNDSKKQSAEAESFMAGIMKHISCMTVFLNPVVNSYERLGIFNAPKYITWSDQNRSQLIRIPKTSSVDYSRMEVRSPDPCCNPYLAFALLLSAGLDGIEENMKLDSPIDFDVNKASEKELEKIEVLPGNLIDAIDAAAKSEFIKKVLPQKTLDKYLFEKKAEAGR
ncbi:MAG: glutamine synthetase family protein [Eubacteriales bacterium]